MLRSHYVSFSLEPHQYFNDIVQNLDFPSDMEGEKNTDFKLTTVCLKCFF